MDRMIANVLGILKIPIDLYKGHKRLNREMKALESLMYELESVKHDLESNRETWRSYDELRVTELVNDIDDFARSLQIPRVFGPILYAFGADPREDYVAKINSFKEAIKLLKDSKPKGTESMSEQGGGSSADTTSSSDPKSSSAAGGYTPEESLVGIAEPKKVLLDLLKKPTASDGQAGGQDAVQRPKVISIVGCPGLGKTALARAVYHHTRASRDFDCVAWVEASGCNNRSALLGKILQEVQAELASRASPALDPSKGDGAATSPDFKGKGKVELASEASSTLDSSNGDGTATSPDLNGMLADKRYLVFVDDVQQAKMWKDAVSDFPENDKSSMLLVTTSIHSVANVCSSYVYAMQCIPPEQLEDLFWRHVYPSGSGPAQAVLDGAKRIISKCGHLPLVLISVAGYLSTNAQNLDSALCVKVGEELGSHYLAGSKADQEFSKLRSTLGRCYEGLPSYEHKTCMLYLSIFPRNHPIKSKSLVRRLIAEGLVAGVGREYLDDWITLMRPGQECLAELIDRCVVDPVQICSWSKDVTSCRVCGEIMLEFIIHKSQLTNLVSLIREEVVRNDKGRIRRLSVQSSAEEKFQELQSQIGLTGMRSLTIFNGNFSTPLSNIINKKDCKLLILLDLEGCRGVDEVLFGVICEMIYLKYLSLRKTDVQKIPSEIEKLRCLQTLDIRETQEIKLPIQVIKLPKLAFLFGQFVLPEMSSGTKEFLKRKSELHTVAGFVVDGAKGYEILEARKLRKVKIWCGGMRQPRDNDFIQSFQKSFISLDSVSIHFKQPNQDNLASLEGGPSTIKCMKLWGKLGCLPFMNSLGDVTNLSKLQLSCTGLAIYVLSTLQHIPCLEYLKLQDDEKEGTWGGTFIVNTDGFQSLRRLCFQASKLPKLQFDTGSMKSLISLHLLCPDVTQMQVADEITKSISHVTCLKEVILHASATNEIVRAWKTAAKSNANSPYVNRLQD